MAIQGIGGGTPDINSILNQTAQAKQPGAFRRLFGGVVGGVANMFAPGVGSLIGHAISGGIGSGGLSNVQGSLSGDTMQFLQLQQQMNAESRAFETASNVLKARHDSAMSAIRNMH